MSKYFAPAFARGLERGGLKLVEIEDKLGEIQQDALEHRRRTRSFNATSEKDRANKEAEDDKKTLTRVTGRYVSRVAAISQGAVRKGLLREDRDTIAPMAAAGLQRELDRWNRDCKAAPIEPPAIPLIVAMRNLRINPDLAQQTAKALMDHPQLVYVNGQRYYTHIEKKIVVAKNGKTEITVDTDKAIKSVNPKKAARDARRQEYERDRRLVRRSWLVEGAAEAARKKASHGRVEVTFITEAEYLRRQGEAANPPSETSNPQLETKKESLVKTTNAPQPQTESKRGVSAASIEAKGIVDIIIKPTTQERIAATLEYFQTNEYEGGPIAGGESLAQRLRELTQGREVPYNLVNCIMFDMEARGQNYPAFTALRGENLSLVGFYQERIADRLKMLSALGKIQPYVIIPNSELNHKKLWEFTQTEQERDQLIETIRGDLTVQNRPLLDNFGARIVTWSEYTDQMGLQKPEVYTARNVRRIKREDDLREEVTGEARVKRTRGYLAGYIGKEAATAISSGIIQRHLTEYEAMYMGEGEASEAAKAIVEMNEERDVWKMYKLGSRDKLAMVTPVEDIQDFYRWRADQMRARKIGRFKNG